MRKRLLSTLSALCMVLALLPGTALANPAAAGAPSVQFFWGGTMEEDVRVRSAAAVVMAGMTPAEKAGQLFLLQAIYNGTSGEIWTVPSRIISTVEQYAPGGFILMGPPFQNNSPDQLAANIAAVQAASNIPLIISTDEEGGRVARASSQRTYRSATFLSPSAIRNAAGSDEKALALAAAQGREMAELLLPLGVNMDHAPVVDTAEWNGVTNKPYMVDLERVWGGTAEETAEYARAAAGAMEGAGLGTTLKHFPSYGNAATDGHTNVVRYSASQYTLDDLYKMAEPFVAGMEAGSEAVMVTHNVYDAFDPLNSMSVSTKLYKFLREDVGFDGLAMTDSLDMAGIVLNGKTKNASSPSETDMILAAIEAGADMVITSNTGAIANVVAKMSDPGFAARVEEACMRVLCWKVSHGLIEQKAPEISAPDGSVTVVETAGDGTVTTRKTAANGVEVTMVQAPGAPMTITVDIPAGVGSAAVIIPAAVTPGTVAIDVTAGEVIKLSIPTADGMAVLLDRSASIILEDRSKSFSDTSVHWAQDSVAFAAAHGLFNGTSAETFAPDSPMTRAMLMTVLARLNGVDTGSGSNWYEKGMEWAVANGISDGTDPDGEISREQLVTMLWRYAGEPASSYVLTHSDAGNISGYAQTAMAWAVEVGIISGYTDKSLHPAANATRAEVAAIIQRFCTDLVLSAL